MTVGENIKELVNAVDYTAVRVGYSDEFIDFVKEMLPHDYDLLKEKEEEYQQMVKFFKNAFKNS